jgi:NAD(P)-dependent dehydrogenase (short-subunit alcohol dehydrogenase family)
MDLGLQGKRALISGSTAGIGFAIASALASEGARVIVNGRTQPTKPSCKQQAPPSGSTEASSAARSEPCSRGRRPRPARPSAAPAERA